MRRLWVIGLAAAAMACAHGPRASGTSTEASVRPERSEERSDERSRGAPTPTSTPTATSTATPDTGPARGDPSTSSGEPRAEPDRPITFAAVGDVMLGSSFPDETGGFLPPDDGRALLAEFTPVIAAADVAFANLEAPLLDAGPSEKCKGSKSGRCFAFRVPTRYGALLRDAGFDVVSLANNHVGDFGEAGRVSTRATLDALGIRYSGAPGEVARLEVRGRRVAVVAFSVSAGTNDLRDIPGAAALVAELARGGDLVVVSFHGGAEGAQYQHVPPGGEAFYGEDRGDLRAFARAVIDAGAALVIGHGPHVVRGLELYRGRLVAYSLGNFATYGGMNLSGPNGLTLVLEAELAPDGAFLRGRIHPGVQPRPGGPRIDPERTVIPILRQLSREDFGPSAVVVSDDGALTPPASAPGA